MKMVLLTVTAVLAIVLGVDLPAIAQGKLLSEQQARAKAIGILKGDPYGTTAQAVAKNIKKAQLVMAAASNCGGGYKVNKPVWQFHVTVPAGKRVEGPIDGWLVLDGRTGEMFCASLPLLD